VNIGEMQRKLSQWATQAKEFRFFDLYHLLYDKEWLRLAHDYVSQNAGSRTAGCDGIDMRRFDMGLEENLQSLSQALRAGTFEPDPVRRTYIPKPNGKERPIGIPSIKDRIVQEALRMVLEPIFEADFSQYSFGFRPNRRTMDAIMRIQWSTMERKKFFWVIEGDISSYFDTINHRKLLRFIARRVRDKKILQLIKKFLQSGVMERRTFRDTILGTPQGGIISPLLANIYLHELDKYMMEQYTHLPAREKDMRRRRMEGNFVYIRYADDFVVLSNGSREGVEIVREELYQFLKDKLHLTLSKEKTKITHLNDGFKFLGFHIQRRIGGRGRMVTKVTIPKEAMAKFRQKVYFALGPRMLQSSVHMKIQALNRIIRGWCQYYQYTGWASAQFNKLNHPVYKCMAFWLGYKFRISMPEVMRRFQDGSTFATTLIRLLMPGEFKTRIYQYRFPIGNPYLLQKRIMIREDLPTETYWTGYERRPNMADLRPVILERDDNQCQVCGVLVSFNTSEIDHIRPVRRFKRPVDANVPENLWTLCIPCHRAKTQSDRQGESRVR
jgi:RNA-directed DNA polymerase